MMYYKGAVVAICDLGDRYTIELGYYRAADNLKIEASKQAFRSWRYPLNKPLPEVFDEVIIEVNDQGWLNDWHKL